jgi:hypothetical protein
MTNFEYQTLIFPPNLFHNLEEFKQFIQIKEDGWEKGLQNLLVRCENEELYEYCDLIKKELEK